MSKKKRVSDRNVLGGPGTKPKKVPPNSGLFHTVIDCANIAGAAGEIQFQKAQDEQIISNNGAWIVLGSDRPNSLRSGYGAMGGCRAASIDLVVGRLTTARKGKGPRDGAIVNPDFSADAARIHISQMTNIDHNFGIAQGNSPQSIARSGIGIKADAVRVIGREGVKIVTGGMQDVRHQKGGEPTSLGKKIAQPSPTIEFLAGNGVEDQIRWGGIFNPRERIRGLQGVAKGANTRDALVELADALMMTMMTVDVTVDVLNRIQLGIGLQFWMTPLALVATQGVIENMLRAKMSINVMRSDLKFFHFRYLTPGSYKCIWSTNVKTT